MNIGQELRGKRRGEFGKYFRVLTLTKETHMVIANSLQRLQIFTDALTECFGASPHLSSPSQCP
jgi:hypothetical protein